LRKPGIADKHAYESPGIAIPDGKTGAKNILILILLTLSMALTPAIGRAVAHSPASSRFLFSCPGLGHIIGFSAGFGVSPIGGIVPLTFYREGVWQGLSAATRVACDMTWLAAVLRRPSNGRGKHGGRWGEHHE
jgi:hypothetical protein